MERRLFTLFAAALVLAFLPGTGCEPAVGPAVYVDGDEVLWFRSEGVFGNRELDAPMLVLSAVEVVIDEGDSGARTTLVSETPDIVSVEPSGETFIMRALAVGEAVVRVENPCPSFGGSCQSTFTVEVVEGDRAEWASQFRLFYDTTTTNHVFLRRGGRHVAGDYTVESPDMPTDESGAFVVTAPATGAELPVRVSHASQTYELVQPIGGYADVGELTVNCRDAECTAHIRDTEDFNFRGAPVVWTYDGVRLPTPETGSGTRFTYEADSDIACTVCASVPFTAVEDCRFIACGVGEVAP